MIKTKNKILLKTKIPYLGATNSLEKSALTGNFCIA